MKVISHQAQFEYYDDYRDMNDEQIIQLCSRSQDALSKAYAVYSNFKVGSSILLENGEIITGGNQENAVYPLGQCAERVAIYAALSTFPEKQIMAIAVATSKELGDEMPAFPCGSCRQVMVEVEDRFGTAIPIYVIGSDNRTCVVKTVRDILPFAFGKLSL